MGAAYDRVRDADHQGPPDPTEATAADDDQARPYPLAQDDYLLVGPFHREVTLRHGTAGHLHPLYLLAEQAADLFS